MGSNLVQLVSSDWNGTLIHGETAVDILKCCKGDNIAWLAREILDTGKKRNPETGEVYLDGKKSLQDVAKLARGISLAQFVDYARGIRYVKGFFDFARQLSEGDVPLVINSTGYTVVFQIVPHLHEDVRFHGWIANELKFSDGNRTLTEEEVGDILKGHFRGKVDLSAKVKATGRVKVNVGREEDKFTLLESYLDRYFPALAFRNIAHIDDTTGGNYVLSQVAFRGGIGVAFNYDSSIPDRLGGNHTQIEYVGRKGSKPEPDVRGVLPYLGLNQ